MKMNKPKKLIPAILALALALMLAFSMCCSSLAEGDTVTLAELKATAPESVSFTIDGTAYDVRIDIPQADAIPMGYATTIHFDANRVWSRYTPEKGTYSDDSTSTDSLSLSTAPRGKSRRPSVMMDYECLTWRNRSPENNAMDAHRPLEKAQELLSMLGVNAELMVTDQKATSQAYRTKQVGIGDAEHPYAFRIVADTTKPIKGFDVGYYQTSFAQLFNGVRIRSDFLSHITDTVFYIADGAFPNIGMEMLSEDDFHFYCFSLLQMTDILSQAPSFVPLEAILKGVQEQIDNGTLKSIFSLSLCYQPMLVPLAEGETAEETVTVCRFDTVTEARTPFNARILLLPCWIVTGYNTKVGYTYQEGFGVNLYDRDDAEAYDGYCLRFDALTGDYLSNALYDVNRGR